MCRLAAYLGEKLPLKTLLFEPEHSLYVQSWQPKELDYAKLNADGFGFGWYLRDGTPATYQNHIPIWGDSNLPDLAKTLHAPLWLSMVRSATASDGASPLNVQPFKYKRLMFVHNGFIKDFNRGVRHAMLAELSADLTDNIRGLTDSEHMFALLCHFSEKHHGDLTAALVECVHWCQKNLAHTVTMLNVIISDGKQISALRYALNTTAPSLYCSGHGSSEHQLPNFPTGAQLIASERLTDDDACWRRVPESTLLTLERGRAAILQTLS